MSIFAMQERIINEYRKYVQSFFSISDNQIRSFIEGQILTQNSLWPDPLIQLNPTYTTGTTINSLVQERKLHSVIGDIFRDNNDQSIILYRHQQEAIEKALNHQHFVVTSGTGSGKTLAYFIPIFNAILNGNPQESKVWAIIVYPMNALVNSQFDSLNRLAESYKERIGNNFPIRFEKYTGQENDQVKLRIQQNPPHIILTNYVMLELMLIRPGEHTFVDRTTTNLQFLVLDELHTHRGRQGADVAMLVRRLRERCGNPKIMCIGTSATMVAGKTASPLERQRAVAGFASRLFGVDVPTENIIEESLQPIVSTNTIPSDEALIHAVQSALPESAEQLLSNPLTVWIENTFGLEQEQGGNYRRKIPITIKSGAEKLSEITGIDSVTCEQCLRDIFLKGSDIKLSQANPVFAFKVHQFIAQGRNIYATLEEPSKRYLGLAGQYYAPSSDEGNGERILYPLLFCRVCGQEYYTVLKDDEKTKLLPYDPDNDAFSQGECTAGYIMIPTENTEVEWTPEHLPNEWFDQNGRVKRDYRGHIPQPLWISPDGIFRTNTIQGSIKAWFQMKPFMLCQSCGEFYSRRDKKDFRKLTGLSSEGRSTATTILSVSSLLNAHIGGITGPARKILSFTDNRQDASLQAGHFNDFVKTSLLRAAIFSALQKYIQLRYDNIADSVVSSMELMLRDIAVNPQLHPDTPQGKDVWRTFRDLIELRLYEDLRRGWRIVQPNLEQCGLLNIEYIGLDELCADENYWDSLPILKETPFELRRVLIKTILDHFRRKLAIVVGCLTEQNQQQLKRKVQQQINEKWTMDEKELLHTASRFILPGNPTRIIEGMSLSDNSLIGRYLKKTLGDMREPYTTFLNKLLEILIAHGFLRKGIEQDIEYVQLDASTLVWKKGDGTPPPPDLIYSRRVTSEVYIDAQRKANEFFSEFYQKTAQSMVDLEGREHTAQVSYDDRVQREEKFREGTLPCLFCSPTMELGIDIADLQMVHLRNIPPTPANYAQRSGRAGRKGDPALVLTYCAAQSGHDQYFFNHREEMVSGVVRPPRIDLTNEDLIKAHLHAVWLAKVKLNMGNSISDLLELRFENLPLNEDTKSQITLSEARLAECLEEARRILLSCEPEISESGWFNEEWLKNIFKRAPEEFNISLDRWRELYKAADKQWEEANNILRYPVRDRRQRGHAEAQRSEAERQKNLLCYMGTTREESDFYPYRYLASEGFLPGYNFPRLPVRAFIPRNDGEFVSRSRFLGITEFGPKNVIYHEGAKYQVGRIISPPGGLQSRRSKAKICNICGYFHSDESCDLCENCHSRLDASNSVIIPLLEMFNVKTWRRDRITCDEEERLRFGFEVTTHFRFAPLPGGQKRILEGVICDEANTPSFRLIYAPAAELFRINHGWRNRREKGFAIDLANGEWLTKVDIEEDDEAPPQSARQPDIVRLYVKDTENVLLLYPARDDIPWSEEIQATLQYAIQRGIEQIFQVEESEIASERIGRGSHRALLFWEAAEGGVGVLRRLVEEQDTMAQVIEAALQHCHFDPQALTDSKEDCVRACYECLLSYTNQRDYPLLNRHLIKDILAQLRNCLTQQRKGGRDYEEHYRWLRSLTDSRSDLERRFIDLLYQTKRRLPDEAQKPLAEYYSIPDFFYEPNVCVFCDGSVHDDPQQKDKDDKSRRELRELGYRVVVIRYDKDLEAQIEQSSDIFGEMKR
jgi:superfamily II DNA/RNA helicase